MLETIRQRVRGRDREATPLARGSHPLARVSLCVVPNAITLGSLLCGFVAITRAFEGETLQAAWLICLANFLDLLDGRVAKGLHATSALGAELDTFSDLVTFGVAPATLIYVAYLHDWGAFGVALAAAPLAGAALRLALYNLSRGGAERTYFSGLPTPAAAVLMAGWTVLTQSLAPGYREPLVPAALAVLTTILMLSPIPFESNVVVRPSAILRTWKGLFFLGALAVFVVHPNWIFLWGALYTAFGVGRWLVRRKVHELAGAIVSRVPERRSPRRTTTMPRR